MTARTAAERAAALVRVWPMVDGFSVGIRIGPPRGPYEIAPFAHVHDPGEREIMPEAAAEALATKLRAEIERAIAIAEIVAVAETVERCARIVLTTPDPSPANPYGAVEAFAREVAAAIRKGGAR